MQLGSVREIHGTWYLRYYVDEKDARRRVQEKLGRVDEMTDKEAEAEGQRRMGILRGRPAKAGSETTFGEYANEIFLPAMQQGRYTTYRFYRQTLQHVLPVIGAMPLRKIDAGDCQRVLDMARLPDGSIPSHQTLLRIRSAMSAVFSFAILKGRMLTINPVRETKAAGRREVKDTHAYSLEEVEFMVKRLDEPARTLVATAAFSGLRESELRGLQWTDYEGKRLVVNRALWGWTSDPTLPKSERSKGSIPVIPQLRKYLDAHKARNGHSIWIFPGQKDAKVAVNLDNMSRRIMKPILGDRWHGWHGFRRGLLTTLWKLKVPVEVAAAILRNDVAVARAHYLKMDHDVETQKAMNKLEKSLKSGWGTMKNHKPR